MQLRRAITSKLTNYDDPNSLGSRLRRRRVGLLLGVIDHALSRRQHVRILDLGGTRRYWRILPQHLLDSGRLHITLLNNQFPGQGTEENKCFEYLAGDACHLPSVGDNAYDIVHSNSVIEHVGSWQRMKAFALEVRRLAPSYYIQTPNVWFPIEPHFVAPLFHWFPVPCRAWILTQIGLGHYERAPNVDVACTAVEGINLLGPGQFRFLFPDALIRKERLLGLPKSLIAMRLEGR